MRLAVHGIGSRMCLLSAENCKTTQNLSERLKAKELTH